MIMQAKMYGIHQKTLSTCLLYSKKWDNQYRGLFQQLLQISTFSSVHLPFLINFQNIVIQQQVQNIIFFLLLLKFWYTYFVFNLTT